MFWIQFLFWLLVGLLYLGVSVPYQEIVIGLCALIIAAEMLFSRNKA